MKDKGWKRHFSQPEPTQYQLFTFRATEVGYARAYREIYGECPCNSAREFAEHLHRRGKSIRQISLYCLLRFGVGAKSTVHRWINPDAMARHLKSKRKS